MKIFFIWPGGSETGEIMDKLIKNGHQIVYWVCDTKDEKRREDMIVHDHFKAWSAVPAEGVPYDTFLPPDKNLLEELSPTESIVLTMMNKGFDGTSIEERKAMYYEMVRYWRGVLDFYQPEAVVMPAVPHSSYAYVLYILAKRRKLKIVMFENPWVSDRMLVYNDYEVGSPDLIATLQKNKGKSFKVEDLSDDLKDYYFWQKNKKEDHTPIYMKVQNRFRLLSRFFPVIGFWESVKNRSFFSVVFQSLKKRIGPNLAREYKKYQTEPDWLKKFIYFPLSVQPERTSCPQAGVFVNQILAAQTLSSALPKGWEVYIKEHPSQWVLRTGIAYNDARYPGYYRRLAEIKNVRLVPIDTNTHELMEKSALVAVVAGSAGWEAAMRGKAVLNFGLPWYHNFTGAFKVDSVESVKKAIGKAVGGFKVDDDLVLNYLKSFDEASSHCYMENMLDKLSKLSEKENIEQMYLLIEKGLRAAAN